MEDKLIAVRARLAAACEKRDAAYRAVEEAADDLPEEDFSALTAAFDEAQGDVERCNSETGRLERIMEARAATPTVAAPEEKQPEARSATAKGGKQERTYRPHAAVSFFRDVALRGTDSAAAERLARHEQEVRDISTTATAGGGFIPPAYLGELWADVPRPGRAFADILPKMELPAHGMNLTIPRITTGASVAIQASDNAAINEVDMVEALYNVPIRTIAGQQDVSIQLFERSDPAIDQILFHDLRSSYDQQLDTGLISGAGTSGTVAGIRAISGVNTTSYTDGTPTGAELLPKIYDAAQKIATTRYAPADTIVMHPRRAAWLASQLSSTFPLFQQGSLVQAAGTQDNAMLTSFAGLRVVLDASIGSTYGASTTEDEIYVLRAADLFLMEGGLQTRVLQDIGSQTLTVRLQLYAFVAFAAGRYPTAIAVISGTGLIAPTF